ncbi:hypothetical protein INT47_010712, partial [Mucor saturninus]
MILHLCKCDQCLRKNPQGVELRVTSYNYHFERQMRFNALMSGSNNKRRRTNEIEENIPNVEAIALEQDTMNDISRSNVEEYENNVEEAEDVSMVVDGEDDDDDDDDDEGEEEEEEEEEEEACAEGDIETNAENNVDPKQTEAQIRADMYGLFAASFKVKEGLSDKAADTLLQFLNIALKDANDSSQPALPKSFKTVEKKFNGDWDAGVTRYTVCGKCHSLYAPEVTKDKTPSQQSCSFVSLDGDVCDEVLFEQVKKRNGKTIFKPKFVYPYKSLKSSLQELMLRPEFESTMNDWRLRNVVPGTYYDIYDGKMFKTLTDNTGLPFSTLRNPLYATLNVDWFQPFDNVNYSCGAIYMCINNWKREDRFKEENIILVGLMPVGKEPKLDRINTYLKPLVDELLELENGVMMKTGAKPDGIKIHCALLMLACDIPACRKVAGFAAHSSGHACNKCEGEFPLVEGKPDFSGINTVASKWPERSKASNLRAALRWRNATTEKEREDLVKANGTRYSELHRLGYFDVVRQSIIDPMHNLLLGTCSRFVKIWKEEGYLTKVNLEKMQVLADSVELPAGFESVDQKIASGFTNFKADNWKSWCLLYSPFVLTGILPKENMKNWMDFVNACRYILKTGIQQSEIDKAHELFLDFNRVAEGLYGNKCLAMNQHLHGHLKQTIEDFSAPHAYWLFSFERCNGYLGSFKNNGKNVEVTFMKKFLEKYNLQHNTIRAYNKAIKSPSPSSPSFQLQKDMETFLHERIMVGGRSNDRVKRQIEEGFVATEFAESCVNLDINVTGSEPLPLGVVPPKVLTKTVMEESHYKCLLDFYDAAYPGAMALGLLNSDLVAPPFGARWPTTSV